MHQQKNWTRRTLSVIMALLLCALAAVTLPGGQAEDAWETEVVSGYPYTTVTNSSVNLRASRSVRSDLIKKIPKGVTITVYGTKGDWAEVSYGKYTGYVKSEFIVLKTVQKVSVTPEPTPVPTLSPEENAGGYTVLRRGSTGSEVRALQEALIELGFLSGRADGDFGAATENAVIAFQRANNYPDTGLMDANIQAFLYVGSPKNAQGQATKIKTLSPVPGVTMKQGNTGEAVGKLQTRLKELGFYTGTVNNTYDAATKAAVQDFQRKNGLKVDGIAGAATQEKVFDTSALTISSTPTPEPTPEPTPTPKPTEVPTYTIPQNTVKQGSEGSEAKTVQRRLRDLGYYTGKLDGVFGKSSVEALKKFQSANGLIADGKAGKSTYNILFSYSAKTAAEAAATPTPTPEPTPTPTPEPTEAPTAPAEVVWTTLRQGSFGQEVTQLQDALIELGYLSGKADGNYGPQTAEAVKAFQKANGLKEDGLAGEETQKLLYGGNGKKAETKAAVSSDSSNTSKSTSTDTLRQGDTGSDVRELQRKLIQLGFLKGTADGIFGTQTTNALIEFQKANKLTADGIAGSKTQAKLDGTSVAAEPVSNAATTVATASLTTSAANNTGTVVGKPSASKVIYANWYTTVKAVCRSYPYATVYDYQTGISWQVHIFSLGAHADFEPLTANDTAKMLKAFGGKNTWNPRPVWVIFADGSVYMASTHSNPHGVQHTKDNNFSGHACIHFPRTQEQVTAIGPYATSHQEMIDKGWAATQAMK